MCTIQQLTIVATQLGQFALTLLIGVVAVKCKALNEEGLDHLSTLIIRVITPCLLFTNITGSVTRQDFIRSYPMLIGAAALLLCLYFLADGLGMLFHLKGDHKNIYKALAMFGNVGFVGLPLITVLYPDKGVLYVSLFFVVDRFVLWTLGVKLTTPVSGQSRLNGPAMLLNVFKNPVVIAILLAVLFVFAQIPVPGLLMTSLASVGACSGAIAMVYVGGLICYSDFRPVMRTWEYYAILLVKMTLFPIVFFKLSVMLGLDREMAAVLAIIAGLPSMLNVAIFSRTYGSDSDYAMGGVSLSTVACVLTLPVVGTVIQLI